tara:strand:- start:633 stop:956 length:324 start_codon:yes stop_codon:yes gene_type:complete
MLFFWTLYLAFSFLISFAFYKLFSHRWLGFVLSVILFGLLSGVWFIYPGSQELAPIVSIFFLENTIVESNGYLRLFRPFLISLFVGLFFGLVFIFFKKKLGFRKRKD